MKLKIQHNWNAILGESVEIRRSGEAYRVGIVDAVTADGSILWILGDGVVTRTMFERVEGYEVWVSN